MIKSHLKRIVFEVAFLFSWLLISTHSDASEKPKIASINLCTDRLVLALAEPQQIISLSYVAADAHSMIKTAAKNVKLNHGRLEELLALDVDYIVASEFDDPRLLERLRDYGKDIVQFTAERTIEQAIQNVKLMSKLLAQTERGELIVDQLNRIEQLEKITGSPRTLLLGANNYISGKNTLASHLIETMGYRNIADEVSITDYGRISIEQVIELNPQVIIISKYSSDYSRAQSVLQHPVLIDLSKQVRVVNVPTREWICGDAALVDAAKRLAAQ